MHRTLYFMKLYVYIIWLIKNFFRILQKWHQSLQENLCYNLISRSPFGSNDLLEIQNYTKSMLLA